MAALESQQEPNKVYGILFRNSLALGYGRGPALYQQGQPE
jgi:hypothetical protein